MQYQSPLPEMALSAIRAQVEQVGAWRPLYGKRLHLDS